MKKNIFQLMTMLSLTLFFAVTAIAQPAPKAPGKDKRAEVAEKVKEMRKQMIVDELKLDQKTQDKLFPVLDSYGDKIRALREEQRDLKKQIDDELAKPKADEKKVDGWLDDLAKKELAMQTLKSESFQATKGILSPIQRAALLELLPRLDREVREMIMESKRGHKKRPYRRP